ncbi:MAG: hypothetical protein ACE5IK_00605 [Acidobacteriota bacterium]
MTSSRTHVAVALVVVAGLFVGFAAMFVSSGVEVIDDAYISFRYAANLVAGNGLVYNPGEAVQGYTNFLWVLLAAAGIAAGISPVLLSVTVGFLAGLTTVGLTVWWSMRVVAPGRLAAHLAGILLVSNMGFVVWSIRGLETGLFTLWILAAGLIYLHRGPEQPFPRRAALLLALACLTRPEGMLIAGLTVAHLVGARIRRRLPMVSRGDLAAAMLFCGLVGAYGAWTVWYYGDLLPNTFHAKVGGPADSLTRGFGYIRKFTGYGTGRPLWLLVFAVLPGRRAGWTRSYAALLCSGYVVYVTAVGGDVFPAYRFLIPVLPYLYLLVTDGAARIESLGLGLDRVGGRSPGQPDGPTMVSRVGMGILIVTLALSTFHPSRVFARREWEGGNRYTRDMRMVGGWLRQHLPPGTWVAVNPAGALPYTSRLPTIDMLGLNDREIALTPVRRLGSGRLAGHEKGNGKSVFRRRPGVILVGGVKLDQQGGDLSWVPHNRSERELARLPGLYDIYRLESHRMPDGRHLTLLVRRDLRIRAADPGA